MNTVIRTLQRFGLGENEAKVYVQILKDGETSPYRLARETGIPRTTIYEHVMSLALKGLIELEKSDGLAKQQTKLRPKNPSILRKIVWQRKEEMSKLDVDLVHILPELKSEYHKTEPNADFMFYPGIEGAKKVMLMEDEGQMQEYVWDYQTPMDSMGPEFINEWVSRTTEAMKNSKWKVKELFPLNEWSRHVTTYQYGRDPNYIKSREFRYIDDPVFDIKQRFAIKGERVLISNIEEDEMWGLVIKSPSLAKSLRSIFLMTWQIAKPVTDEVVKSWGSNEFLMAEQGKP
ncbi:MAG: Transcriptional regulator, TrmB [Microgenomates group bacterium GW2011_GWA2_44_7]|nr:MAG: Transcriptional regulator, TrmB [Microgenomates group bacterium GW2011_GWA2_44_7]KKT77380.1 MAG: Transcriptional regulator, TrmB [Microgenomates group bacterium GW2011_GWB1_44_8]